VSFKPSRATYNDAGGRIRPAGLVFDTCAVEIKFNSVYFIQPNITNYVFASEDFTIRPHRTSLTFDLSHRIRMKLPRNIEKKLSLGKKVEKPSGEQQRRIPLQDGQRNICMSCDQKESLQSYINTFCEYYL